MLQLSQLVKLMRIALYYREDKIEKEFISSVESKVLSFGHSLDNKNPEVAIFIGGDGTFLRAVQHYINDLDKISFVGLHKGHLGFFYNYNEEIIDQLFSDLASSNFHKESYRLLEASFNNNLIYAVNEVRIESPFHSLVCKVHVNNEYLETFKGNGLVICSSIGSSAYNKSLSGAVVNPSLEVLQLSEIAPINNRVYSSLHSSLIVDKNSEITLSAENNNVLVGFDHLVSDANESPTIKVRLSNKLVNVLYRSDYSYLGLIHKTFIGEK